MKEKKCFSRSVPEDKKKKFLIKKISLTNLTLKMLKMKIVTALRITDTVLPVIRKRKKINAGVAHAVSVKLATL